MVQILSHLHSPFLDLHQFVSLSRLEIVLMCSFMRTKWKRNNQFPWGAGFALPHKVKSATTILCNGGHCQLLVQCFSQCFSLGIAIHQSAPNCNNTWGYSISWAGLCADPCWTLWNPCSSIPPSCQDPSKWHPWPLVCLLPCHSVASSLSWLSVCSIPLSRSFMEILSNISLSVEPGGAPHAASHQQNFTCFMMIVVIFFTHSCTHIKAGPLYKSVEQDVSN